MWAPTTSTAGWCAAAPGRTQAHRDVAEEPAEALVEVVGPRSTAWAARERFSDRPAAAAGSAGSRPSRPPPPRRSPRRKRSAPAAATTCRPASMRTMVGFTPSACAGDEVDAQSRDADQRGQPRGAERVAARTAPVEPDGAQRQACAQQQVGGERAPADRLRTRVGCSARSTRSACAAGAFGRPAARSAERAGGGRR